VVIDTHSLHKLRLHLQGNKVKALLIMGTTGEFLYMSQQLRLEGLKAMIDEFHGHFLIFAHATGSTQPETFEIIHWLLSYQKKVDAIAILPMFYHHGNDSEVLAHLQTDFREFSSIPLILYNNPSITGGRNLPFSIVESDGVPFVALKDSSGDDEVSKQYCKQFVLYAGTEKKILSYLKLGARGAVAGMGNINSLPQDLFEAFLVGDDTAAQTIQNEICQLSPVLTGGGGRPFIAGFKYSAHVLGLMEYILAPENKYDITKDQKTAIEVILQNSHH